VSFCKEFRVRLTEQEVRGLLEAIDSKCLQLLEEHMKAEDRLHELISADRLGQTPQFEETSRKTIEARNKIVRLESVELQFQNLLRGKTRGRRQKVPLYLTRLRNLRILSGVREKINAKRRKETCKPVGQ
jgi:cell division septum initiation protein DivIVA